MKKLTRILMLVTVVVGSLMPPSAAADGSGEGKLIFDAWGLSDVPGILPSYDIWIVNPDGTGLKNLTANTSAYEGTASWSPDRSKIAFDSTRTGNDDIFVMNPDGTGQRRLTSSKLRESYATWSPDGQAIAYAKGTEIWIMNADGSNKRRIFVSRSERVIISDWSPDGRWISFNSESHFASTDQDIQLIHPDGSGLRKMFRTPEDEAMLVWSPDGKSVAFHRVTAGCSAPLGTLQGSGCDSDIYTARVDGRGQKNLTRSDLSYWEYEPSWSPDGTKIAYTYEDEHSSDIFIIDADGSNSHRVVLKPDSYDFMVDW